MTKADQGQGKATTSRRDLLKMIGMGAPVAAAGVVVGGATASAAEAPTSLGMTKTEHVKKYLESARF